MKTPLARIVWGTQAPGKHKKIRCDRINQEMSREPCSGRKGKEILTKLRKVVGGGVGWEGKCSSWADFP